MPPSQSPPRFIAEVDSLKAVTKIYPLGAPPNNLPPTPEWDM